MQIRSTAILSSPCSPNPFTTFLPTEVGERSSVIGGCSFQSPRSNLKGFCPSTPLPTPFEAFVVPRLGGTRRGTSTRFRKEAVSSLGGEGGSRALFSDNVSRIETALKQPINGVVGCSSILGLGGQFRQISGNCCCVQERCRVLNRQIVESRTKCRDLLVSVQELPLWFAYCSFFLFCSNWNFSSLEIYRAVESSGITCDRKISIEDDSDRSVTFKTCENVINSQLLISPTSGI